MREVGIYTEEIHTNNLKNILGEIGDIYGVGAMDSKTCRKGLMAEAHSQTAHSYQALASSIMWTEHIGRHLAQDWWSTRN